MGKALSNDLRLRLVKNVESGMSARAAGRKLDIAPSTATGIVQHIGTRIFGVARDG